MATKPVLSPAPVTLSSLPTPAAENNSSHTTQASDDEGEWLSITSPSASAQAEEVATKPVLSPAPVTLSSLPTPAAENNSSHTTQASDDEGEWLSVPSRSSGHAREKAQFSTPSRVRARQQGSRAWTLLASSASKPVTSRSAPWAVVNMVARTGGQSKPPTTLVQQAQGKKAVTNLPASTPPAPEQKDVKPTAAQPVAGAASPASALPLPAMPVQQVQTSQDNQAAATPATGQSKPEAGKDTSSVASNLAPVKPTAAPSVAAAASPAQPSSKQLKTTAPSFEPAPLLPSSRTAFPPAPAKPSHPVQGIPDQRVPAFYRLPDPAYFSMPPVYPQSGYYVPQTYPYPYTGY